MGTKIKRIWFNRLGKDLVAGEPVFISTGDGLFSFKVEGVIYTEWVNTLKESYAIRGEGYEVVVDEDTKVYQNV